MANLGPQHINQSFGDLLQLPNGLTPAIQNVQDGSGNVTPLEISTTAVDLPIVGPDGSGMLSDLGGASGSNFIGFEQAGTGSVLRTMQDKGRESVSVKDFGAVGDGIANDTLAIQNAIDTLTLGGEIYFPVGQYKITSTLTITTNGITLRGANGTAIWNGIATVYEGGSRIVKSSTMTTDAIKCAGGLGFTIENIAITGTAGNTGDGIYLEDGQTARLINVAVSKIGGVGIRVGAKSGVGNVNGWQFINVTSQYNGSHGVYIYDQSTTVPVDGPNANAGTATGLNVAGNTGNGLLIENGQFNTFVGLLSQQNTGYGVVLIGTASLSLYATFCGGDIEANTAGQWNVGANAKHIQFFGASTSAPTIDPSANFAAIITGSTSYLRGVQFGQNSVIDYYQTDQFTPTLAGLSVAGTNTYVWQNGYYTRIGNIVIFEGVLRLSAKGTGGNAMSGDLAINGLPFTGKNSTLARSQVLIIPDGGISVGAGYSTQIQGRINENQNYISLFKISTTDGSAVQMSPSDITDSFLVYMSGTYITN